MIYLYMVYERIYVLKMQATMKNVSWYNNYLHNFKDSDAKSSTLKATFVDEEEGRWSCELVILFVSYRKV